MSIILYLVKYFQVLEYSYEYCLKNASANKFSLKNLSSIFKNTICKNYIR